MPTKITLIGFAEKDWKKDVKWENTHNVGEPRTIMHTFDWHSLELPEITKEYRAYKMRLDPIKLKVTIEEV